MSSRNLALALATLILLALGCSPRGYVRNPAAWLQGVDWTKAERVSMKLSEYRFNPQVMTFREKRAYILELSNTGVEPHKFVAEEFFKAIAAGQVLTPSVLAVNGVYYRSIELAPGQKTQLSFVAVRPGTYSLECSIPGHAEKGMTGALRIVESE